MLAKKAGLKTIISARSGEIEGTTLADLSVGLNGGQIKIGSLAGPEGSQNIISYFGSMNKLVKICRQNCRRCEEKCVKRIRNWLSGFCRCGQWNGPAWDSCANTITENPEGIG
jgi:hypothetical protein